MSKLEGTKGHDNLSKAVLYSYIKKKIKIQLFYRDKRDIVEKPKSMFDTFSWLKEDQLEWLSGSHDVAIVRNVEKEKTYFLSISADSETKIKVEHFKCNSLKYVHGLPDNHSPYATVQQRVISPQKPYEIRHRLPFEDVGTVNELTRIHFDDHYIDIFYEQKEGIAKPPGFRRIENTISYDWQDEHYDQETVRSFTIRKNIEFSVKRGGIFRDRINYMTPPEINWRRNNLAVIHNVSLDEPVVLTIKGNYKTTVKILHFRLNPEQCDKIEWDERPKNKHDVTTLNLTENEHFEGQISDTLSLEEYNDKKCKILRIWFDNRYIDFFFSVRRPSSGLLSRSINCIKCNRALQSS